MDDVKNVFSYCKAQLFIHSYISPNEAAVGHEFGVKHYGYTLGDKLSGYGVLGVKWLTSVESNDWLTFVHVGASRGKVMDDIG